jgi:serine/threonine protein kinase
MFVPTSMLVLDIGLRILLILSTGSDGTAADEAAINSLIEHPLVVSAHGVFLSEDNSCPEGMVMELLDGADALGKPPSFNSVTRDAGPTEIGKDLTREQVLCVVWNVVAALEHVHSTTKVANGDIYLHNVLKCGDCIAKVSDWGASFVYDCIVDSPPQIFESIEVLAFGRLVQDLFDWHLDTALPDATESAECIGKSRGMPLEAGPFYDLMNSILQPIQAERPSFSDIKAVLKSIPEFEAATNAPE